MRSLWVATVLAAASPMLLFQTQSPSGRLAIVRPVFRQYDGGPALPSSHRFLPGESLAISFQIAGFREERNAFRIRYSVLALDAEGIPLAEAFFGGLSGEIAEEDRKTGWLPRVDHAFRLPPILLGGEYRVRLRVRDEIAGTEAELDAPFQVLGPVIEPSAVLVVRNFRFLRSEKDRTPLDPAAYRPGDAVWARFEATGYQLGEKNAFHVDYGLAIENAAGEVVFQNEVAAEDRGRPYYPQRFVPGVLSVTTQPDTPPGSYTLVLTLRDRLGNQTVVTRHTFRIE